MKRSAMPPRRTPLRANKPLDRGTGLRAGKPLRSTTPIRPRSAKQAKRQRQQADLRRELVAERGPFCEIRSPVCWTFEQGLHHVRKQGQGGGDSRDNCLLSCGPCNTYLEDFPDWAHARGFVIRRGDDRRKAA